MQRRPQETFIFHLDRWQAIPSPQWHDLPAHQPNEALAKIGHRTHYHQPRPTNVNAVRLSALLLLPTRPVDRRWRVENKKTLDSSHVANFPSPLLESRPRPKIRRPPPPSPGFIARDNGGVRTLCVPRTPPGLRRHLPLLLLRHRLARKSAHRAAPRCPRACSTSNRRIHSESTDRSTKEPLARSFILLRGTLQV